MTSQMAFAIAGAGYSGFSFGVVTLAFKVNGVKLLYRSMMCQGTSSSKLNCAAFDISNDVGDEVLLFSFQGLPVKFIVSNFISLTGNVGDFEFQIFIPSKSDPVYKTSRKPEMSGVCAGGANVTATFNNIGVENGWVFQNADLWEGIWIGNGGISQES